MTESVTELQVLTFIMLAVLAMIVVQLVLRESKRKSIAAMEGEKQQPKETVSPEMVGSYVVASEFDWDDHPDWSDFDPDNPPQAGDWVAVGGIDAEEQEVYAFYALTGPEGWWSFQPAGATEDGTAGIHFIANGQLARIQPEETDIKVYRMIAPLLVTGGE